MPPSPAGVRDPVVSPTPPPAPPSGGIPPSSAPAHPIPTASDVVVVGLPGQAFFNRHFNTLKSLYFLVSRVLGAALMVLGVAKASDSAWAKAVFGEIQLIQAEAEVEPGSEEESIIKRGTGLLLVLLGLHIIVYTIPARKQGNSGGAAGAAGVVGPKAGKAE